MRLAELNNVIISGRVTQDPKVSMTQTGKEVLSCSIAVNRRYLDSATNEWKDDVVFVPVVVWGNTASRLKDRVHKGTPVVVEGRITSNEYTDKMGQVRKQLQVTANRFQILESPATAAQEPVAETSAVPANDGWDDVPF